MTHICVGNLTIIGSDNGLSPGRRQAIVWTNAGILLIGPLGTNFREILIGIHKFSFTKMHLKMSSAKWRPFSLGLNMLTKKCCFTLQTVLSGTSMVPVPVKLRVTTPTCTSTPLHCSGIPSGADPTNSSFVRPTTSRTTPEVSKHVM